MRHDHPEIPPGGSNPEPALSRREMLKLCGLALGAAFLPPLPDFLSGVANPWPSMDRGDLPPEIASILALTPDLRVDQKGILRVFQRARNGWYPVHLEPTLWNIDNSTSRDRLKDEIDWGIVLHWFADTPEKNLTLDGYMRGFNSMRQINGEYENRTSAHFLVGDVHPVFNGTTRKLSIIQTQVPDSDGTPFVASHLAGISYERLLAGKQYFFNAANNLSYHQPGYRSMLQVLYDGHKRDPNLYTLAIEITGSRFEDPGNFPSNQKIANVLSLVTALMLRYGIPASNLLGHLEIQMNKPDPGKLFMGLIRYLVGLSALVDPEPALKQLVFGELQGYLPNKTEAVRRYFELVREYFVLTSLPELNFRWECLSKYWFLMDQLTHNPNPIPLVGHHRLPLDVETVINSSDYLDPESHEGIDLHAHISQRGLDPGGSLEVHLVANGRCMFAGEVRDCHHNRTAIFLHQQADGGQFLSIYGHLSEINTIQVGEDYPVGYTLGRIKNSGSECGDFLHFAIAYGTVWEATLAHTPHIPLNAGPIWIRERYPQPLEFLQKRIQGESQIKIIF